MGQEAKAGETPIDPNAYAGMAQAHEGIAQGHEGAVHGQLYGGEQGMKRASEGGMEPMQAKLGEIVQAIMAAISGGAPSGAPPQPMAPQAPAAPPQPAAPGGPM